jgi:hypothetical protein
LIQNNHSNTQIIGEDLNEAVSKIPSILHLDAPSLTDMGDNILSFISIFPQPVRIRIPGADNSRCRVLVTLLHGNEPSGLTALHELLKAKFKPAVDIYCYLIAFEAARLLPVFTHRQVPGKRDFNRCFGAPYDSDDQGPVCEQLLSEIGKLQPEAVVDMHNTSGEGPAFGVSTSYDKKHDELVSLFTDRLIITDLKLGALMESNTHDVPIVTIECGGANEDVADRIALNGLKRYFSQDQLFISEAKDYGIELYFNPVRIELNLATSLEFNEGAVPGADITLKPDIEHLNFGLVTPQTLLGWVGEGAMEKLAAFDANRENHFKQFYREDNGGLYPNSNQKMFMITSKPEIAISDCLWYMALEN